MLGKYKYLNLLLAHLIRNDENGGGCRRKGRSQQRTRPQLKVVLARPGSTDHCPSSLLFLLEQVTEVTDRVVERPPYLGQLQRQGR